jgi:hypothetical protein
MSSFDNLPTARPKKKAPPATGAARPSKAAYEFDGPDDIPEGVDYRKTTTGFVASAPSSTWLMACLTGGLSLLLGSFVWRSWGRYEVSSSFFAIIGTISALFFIGFLYFAIGKIRVTAKGNNLYIAKTVFGIGIPRRFHLLKIERMPIRNRSGERALGWVASSTVKDTICEIETDTRISTFGSHLHSKHLYYLRYLVIHRIREIKGVGQTDKRLKE